MKNRQFTANQLNHSNHLSRRPPTKCPTTQHVRSSVCHVFSACVRRSFGPGRGQGITTHSIPRGGNSDNERLAKGPQDFGSSEKWRRS